SCRCSGEAAPFLKAQEFRPGLWAARLLERPAPIAQLSIHRELELGQLRRVERTTRHLRIDPVDARRVESEDLRFDLRCERGIAVFLLELRRDRQRAKRLALRLL